MKVEGTAQFDPFAKELGVIANTIIEGNGIKREKREDNAPDKKSRITYAYTNEPNGWNDFGKGFDKKSCKMGNEIYSDNRSWCCTSLSRGT